MTNAVVYILIAFVICFLQYRLLAVVRQRKAWEKFAEERSDQIQQLCSDLEKAAKLHTDLLDQPRLMSISRKDRRLIFTFARLTKDNPFSMFTIEAMGMLGDDIEQWAKDCGFKNYAGMLMRAPTAGTPQ